MRSLLDDPAVGQDHDPVHRLDRAQAVGDDDRRAPLHRLGQSRLDVHLALTVQRRGGLVEDQQVGVLEHGPGDRDPLALPAGQLHAPLADGRVVARGQPGDELVGAGLHRRLVHELGRGTGTAVGDVVRDRAVEQQRLLGDVGDRAAQRGLGDVAQVLAVDPDGARVDVGEPQQQAGQRRLAAARVADQPDLLARGDGQGEVLEQRVLAGPVVGEGDVVELDRAGSTPEVDIRVVRDGGGDLEDLDHVVGVAHDAVVVAHDLGDLPQLVGHRQRVGRGQVHRQPPTGTAARMPRRPRAPRRCS